MAKDNTIQTTGNTTAFIVKSLSTIQDVFDTLKQVSRTSEWHSLTWCRELISRFLTSALCLQIRYTWTDFFQWLHNYTSAQIRWWDNRRQCRRLNGTNPKSKSKYRIVVEHAIAEIKAYKCMALIWHYKKHFVIATVCLVAKLVVRRKLIGMIE